MRSVKSYLREAKSGWCVTAYGHRATAVSAYQLLSLLAPWEGSGTTTSLEPGLQIISPANVTLSKKTLTRIGTRTTIYKGGNKQRSTCPWHCLHQYCEFHPNVFSSAHLVSITQMTQYYLITVWGQYENRNNLWEKF